MNYMMKKENNVKGDIYMMLDDKQKSFVDLAVSEYGTQLKRSELIAVHKKHKVPFPYWLVNSDQFKLGKGLYQMPVEGTPLQATGHEVANSPINTVEEAPAMKKKISVADTTIMNLIPSKYPNYVPFGQFSDVKSIVKSKMFYPVFVTGLSGNGKTMMIEQVCAQLNREFFRVNITIETDEDDLLGGYRLQDGETVWFDGPVVQAMKKGAVLLLDEVDLASNKIMCIQPILEGKGVLLKKINQFVEPAPGFQIIATANTKGKGSEDGRFIGTNVLNEAFLERFPITIEQEYPSVAIEKKILTKELVSAGKPDEDFADKLTKWADIIRKTFLDGGIDEIIATRRLVHIAKAYAMFGNKMKAIELCINRFDDETKSSFKDLYTKVDADAIQTDPSVDGESVVNPKVEIDKAPF